MPTRSAQVLRMGLFLWLCVGDPDYAKSKASTRLEESNVLGKALTRCGRMLFFGV